VRDEKIRLGGMALTNGVLVHGPHAWACAVRGEDGGLKVASEHKRFRAAEVRSPILRGPARIAEIFAVLPVSVAGFTVSTGCARRSGRLRTASARAGRWTRSWPRD